jgi:predicted nucleic acid-binding protein
MTLVVDASVVVAALVDGGETGAWAEEVLLSRHVAAPHVMPAEVANILRRSVLEGDVSGDSAAMAHADLQDLRIDLFPYEAVADRAWALRLNLSLRDAWYVALAEALDADLATLDRRLVRAPGPRCGFVSPPAPAPPVSP